MAGRRRARSLQPIVFALALLACSEGPPDEAPASNAAGDAGPAVEGPAPSALASGETGAGGETWKVIRRFAPARSASRLPPTATVGEETRPVLDDVAADSLAYAPAKPVPADGRLRMSPPLPPGLQHDAVFVEARVNAGERWVALPGRRLASVHERGKLRVHVDLELPDAAGHEAGIWLRAYAPGGETVHETLPFAVPQRARLDFGTAVLEPAWQAGPVEFGVEACEADGEGCRTLHRSTLDPAEPDGRGFRVHRLGLDALAGRRVVLRFRARPLGEAGVSLAVFADPVLLAPASVRGPNLVLVSLDTLRADHMGAYGYARDTTPFLDSLAREGARFEHFVAAASSTRPSHMTMFTSLQPSVHGATENVGVRSLPVAANTLAELLRDGGVATGAVTENGAIDRSRGFARGFGMYVENRDATRADLRVGRIEQTFAEGLRWLDEISAAGDRRFFLFLHTYQVHNPFTPPPGYDALFEGDGLAKPSRLRDDWDPLLYDREIRYADDQMRALSDALRARGLDEDTYLVVTSDHGEAFLEHGFVAHGASVHREVLRVPWIVTGPDVPAGLTIDAPVPMVDLMPTLLDLMGVPASGQEMGRSQAARIRGEPAEDVEPRAIYSEAWAERAYRAHGFDRVLQPTLAVQLEAWKLIRSRTGATTHRYELYDLARDPGETRDLRDEHPERLARLAEMLEEYDEAVSTLHRRLGEASDAADARVDPDLEEKLRALGYLD